MKSFFQSWVVPFPSNGGKRRFIGIHYYKNVILHLVVTITRDGDIPSYLLHSQKPRLFSCHQELFLVPMRRVVFFLLKRLNGVCSRRTVYDFQITNLPSKFHTWEADKKIWSNYSDLTRPHPKWWLSKGNLKQGKSGLVKYYNLARKNADVFLNRGIRASFMGEGGKANIFHLAILRKGDLFWGGEVVSEVHVTLSEL